MKELASTSAPTFESVWASLQELAKLHAKNERDLKKLHAKNERDLKKSRAETDRQFKEMRLQSQETDRQMKESDRKFKESQEAFEKRWAKYEQKMKKVDKELGSWANNHGLFAEEYFFNSFEDGQQNFFGEKFDRIEKNAKGIEKDFQDEYDILLINGKSIGIVEVKFKAHENDISEVLKKATTFRVNFPKYKNHKVYLGLATMAFYPELEQKCMQQGIAIIKQVGDNVVIEDGHLRVF